MDRTMISYGRLGGIAWMVMVLNCLACNPAEAIRAMPGYRTAMGASSCYYVDAERGSDSNSGRYVEPIISHRDGPCRTIGAAYEKAQPGDCIFVKKGVYRETLTLSKRASASRPITIRAFPGDEGLAVISGADEIGNWQRCSSATSCDGNPNWQRIVYADVDVEVRQLFQAGSRLAPSRYPDRGWRYPTAVDEDDPTTILRDSQLQQSGRRFAGSTCHVKTNLWHIDQVTVQTDSSRDGWIELALPTRYDITPSYGYYFTHVVADINEPGEWAYDRVRGRVYLWPLGESPQQIEGTRREHGIYADPDCSYHTVQGFAVKYAIDGIRLYRTQHVTLRGNRVDYAYSSGIHGFEDSDTSIVDNTISYANHAGIQNQPLSSNALIEGNTVYATGAVDFGDDLIQGIGYGMFITGSDSRILRNRVDCSGYSGILVGGETSGKEIAYNYITNSCLSLADGGGIYTSGHSSSSAYDYYHHNIVADTWGYLGGYAEYEELCKEIPGQCRGGGCGIYLDEQGNRRIFENNTAVNCASAGIYFHCTQGNRLVGNRLYGNTQCQLLLAGKSGINSILRENDVQGNCLVATAPDQKTLQVEVEYEDVDFGESDDNCFYHPDGGGHIAIRRAFDWRNRYTTYTLAAWTDLTGKDAHSRDFSPQVGVGDASNNPICLINPSTEPATFDLADQEYRDEFGNIIRETVSVDPFGSIILFRDIAGGQ